MSSLCWNQNHKLNRKKIGEVVLNVAKFECDVIRDGTTVNNTQWQVRTFKMLAWKVITLIYDDSEHKIKTNVNNNKVILFSPVLKVIIFEFNFMIWITQVVKWTCIRSTMFIG